MIRSLLAACAISLVSLAPAAAESIKFAVTDIEGMEALQQEFGGFQKALEQASGLEIELFPVSSRTSAVEALNSGQVDLVLTGPAEYVVMKELAQPEIVVAWQRPDYFAQIAVLANGPIRSLEDLKGKKVSFGSVGSTSQHLGPAQALTDFGVKYHEDYEPVILARNVAAEALIRGDIAAIGLNFGHLNSIREAFPDVAFASVAPDGPVPDAATCRTTSSLLARTWRRRPSQGSARPSAKRAPTSWLLFSRAKTTRSSRGASSWPM